MGNSDAIVPEEMIQALEKNEQLFLRAVNTLKQEGNVDSAAQFCKAIDSRDSLIYEIKTGKSSVSFDVILSTCKVFGFDMNYFKGDDVPLKKQAPSTTQNIEQHTQGGGDSISASGYGDMTIDKSEGKVVMGNIYATAEKIVAGLPQECKSKCGEVIGQITNLAKELERRNETLEKSLEDKNQMITQLLAFNGVLVEKTKE